MSKYIFTNSWFSSSAKNSWDTLIPQFITPARVLEIGSYEGASACYLIDKLGSLNKSTEIYCIDTWEGGVEHQTGGLAHTDMNQVEQRFHNNVSTAINNSIGEIRMNVIKGYSDSALSRMIETNSAYFDLIYIDGSHQAPDVLFDALLGFKLLAVGGIMIFDDYLWFEELVTGRDILRCPKPAIDAFVNIYFRKLNILPL